MTQVTKLNRITSPVIAMKMIEERTHFANYDNGHYDAGMNFLGVLGENSNTHPTTRGAIVEFEWKGAVSNPLPPSCTVHHTPNVLYDFNGSGNHFQNNDPRYFLPYGSNGLVIKKVTLEKNYNKQNIVSDWCGYKKGKYRFLSKLPFAENMLFSLFKSELDAINKNLSDETITISVRKGKSAL
ncbi:hypothetical protein NTE05_005267 [Vibrio harveyi]|nr:hypothetical protein [Vibrio harveyi]